jgi:hypothetical protein
MRVHRAVHCGVTQTASQRGCLGTRALCFPSMRCGIIEYDKTSRLQRWAWHCMHPHSDAAQRMRCWLVGLMALRTACVTGKQEELLPVRQDGRRDEALDARDRGTCEYSAMSHPFEYPSASSRIVADRGPVLSEHRCCFDTSNAFGSNRTHAPPRRRLCRDRAH